MRIFRGKKLTGGTASRAEVYGLFLAAILIVGGGIGGAVALTNNLNLPGQQNTSTPTSPEVEPSSLLPAKTPPTSSTNEEKQIKSDVSNPSPKKNSSLPGATNSSNNPQQTRPSQGSNISKDPPICRYSAGELASADANRVRLGNLRTSYLQSISDAQTNIDNLNNVGFANAQRALEEEQRLLDSALAGGQGYEQLVILQRAAVAQKTQELNNVSIHISNWVAERDRWQQELNQVEAAISALPRC